jgi:hypothetical protein
VDSESNQTNYLTYLDFDLRIERSGRGYRAQVIASPAGAAFHRFKLPFSELEVENFVLRMGRTRPGVRGINSSEASAARTFGGRLFDAVFGSDVRGSFRSSIDEAERRGVGLRIRLRLADTPELADLPWEFLHNAALNGFLLLSVQTPLVRYLELARPIRPLAVIPPLRVLAMIASPHDYAPLNVEREWNKLRTAVADLERRGLVTLDRLQSPTLAELRRQLRRREYHIFQFVGHGAFNEDSQDGVLVLEDEDQRGRRISSLDL